jgi:hypothetical protein
MCASAKALPHKPRPAWSRLFAIMPLAAGALLLIEVTVAAGPFRAAANTAIVLATFGAMALWVRANRSALDQLDVCACASGGMLTIRVVRSLPEHPSRHDAPASLPAPTRVSASPGHWTGARLGT